MSPLGVANPRCEQLVNGPDLLLPPSQGEFGRRNCRDIRVDTTPQRPFLSKVGLGATGSPGAPRPGTRHHPDHTRPPSPPPPREEQGISSCLHKASQMSRAKSLRKASSSRSSTGFLHRTKLGTPFSCSDGARGSPKPRGKREHPAAGAAPPEPGKPPLPSPPPRRHVPAVMRWVFIMLIPQKARA